MMSLKEESRQPPAINSTRDTTSFLVHEGGRTIIPAIHFLVNKYSPPDFHSVDINLSGETPRCVTCMPLPSQVSPPN
jgi:hypothetical protein